VESLYRNLLGRGSDPAGKAGWVSVYDANPLNVLGIVDGFITSPEYKTALVTGYYKNLLRRAPDAPGLAGWVTSGFGTPESVEAGFIGSPEYLNVSVTSGVPELSTWAMMIIGFGGVGLQMRRRDRAVALSA
jgi:hypothetical protein